MGLIDKFESTVKKTVTKPFAKKKNVKPIELTSALKNEMDDNAQVLAQGKTVATNIYKVIMNSEDLELIKSWGESALISELQEALFAHAKSQGYTVLGKIRVNFSVNDEYKKGEFGIDTNTKRESIAPATSLNDNKPVLEIAGKRYVLNNEKTVIGRGKDVDIQINEPSISRHHLEIEIVGDNVIATDLNSINGSYVEGNKISKAYLLDGNSITLGSVSFNYYFKDSFES